MIGLSSCLPDTANNTTSFIIITSFSEKSLQGSQVSFLKNFLSGGQEFFVMYDWTRILKQIWIFEDCFMTLTSAHWVFHSLPDTINWEKSWDVYFRLHTSHTGLDQDPRLTIYPVFGISQSQWQQISLYWSEAILIKDMMDCVFLKRCLLLFDRFDSKVGIKPLTYYIFLQGVKKLW